MKNLDSFAHGQDQLNDLSPAVTLVVLHPDYSGQHRLFAPILREKNKTALFMMVPEPDCSFDSFRTYLKDALQTQLNTSVPDLPADPQTAGAMLGRLLEKQGNVTLIIDAYDLVQQDNTAPFVASLARGFATGSRVILGTRELPMNLLERGSLAGKMALLPVNPSKMMLDYTQPTDKTILEVRALGPGRVLIDGRLVEHWDGVLPRTLFFYFVDRGMITRDEIFQTFWPTLTTREATNVFHVTKRKISEILGTDLTVYWSGFYRISPELELHYDVVKFAEAVQNAAVASDEEGLRMLHDAIDLYHGPFLSMTYLDWVVYRRDELAMTYAEALAGLARKYTDQGAQANALGYYLRAAATSPQREDLARSIMRLFHDLGQPAAALETYDQLESQLRESLNVAPAPQTAELAEAIRASM